MNDKWKFVSVGQCIRIIVFSILFGICIGFIPYSIAPYSQKTVLSFSNLPIFGNGSFCNILEDLILTSQNVLKFGTNASAFFGFFIKSSIYFFYGILVANIIFATILAICRVNIVRVVFKIFSTLFAFIYIILTIIFLLTIILILLYLLNSSQFTSALDFLFNHGTLTNIGLFIFSFVLIFCQFKWFTKPY